MTTKTIYSNYKHTSKTSGKSYIGVSLNPEKRKKGHNQEAHNINGTAYNTYFKRAIRKYGIDDFETTILWQTPCKETAYLAEVYFIALYDTHYHGYNGTKGGDNPPTFHTQEFKKLQSNRMTELWKDDEFRTKQSKISKNQWSKVGYRKNHTEKVSKTLSKEYQVTLPDGEQLDIKGLKKFCQNNNLNYKSAWKACKDKRPFHGYFFKSI